ncbi:MAG: phosphodiester glycosidase family protein [Patescibacteria group bacterium]|jgi:exopolysaccharide biosynthesis protein|nr:phosphodiester glycosidase family protein [Patescibacteria group bacterium]
MKKILFSIIIFIVLPSFVSAESLSQKLSGKILLNVKQNGEAWYIYPKDNKRYFLGRPADAFSLMRELGLGITEFNFQKLAKEGNPVDGDIDLARSLSGLIILQVEENGEAWYVNPDDLKIYYLGRPDDAFQIMRRLSLGISRENLALIHKPGFNESINSYSKYEHTKVDTVDGVFSVDYIEIDLSSDNIEIITDTAEDYNCKSGCAAKTLASFAIENDAFAAINGSYFCSSSGCSTNYYFAPIYNSIEKKLINDDQLKYWTTGPVVAFDTNNKYYYFKDSREFKSVEDFEATNNVKLQAAISNKPRLIEDGKNILIEWDIDEKQRNVKATRNALSFKEDKMYLIVTYNSTLVNLANVLKSMEMEYALNLDGGYSAALFYNDEYMVGPGRDIPNALLIREK